MSSVKNLIITDLSNSMLINSVWEKLKYSKSYTVSAQNQKSLLNKSAYSIVSLGGPVTETTASCFPNYMSVNAWIFVNNLSNDFVIVSGTNSFSFWVTMTTYQINCSHGIKTGTTTVRSLEIAPNNISGKWTFVACSISINDLLLFSSNSAGSINLYIGDTINQTNLLFKTSDSSCFNNLYVFDFLKTGAAFNTDKIMIKQISLFNSFKDITTIEMLKNK
jgi:hypothetical protein